MPRPKAGFVKDIISGKTPRQAAQRHLDVCQHDPKPFNRQETREMNQHLISSAADRAMRDERVAYALYDELRRYQTTWRDIEEAVRGVLARFMSGKELMPDGTAMPIEGLEPWQLEQLRLRAALGALQVLARDPEALAINAAREDRAAKMSLKDMAALIVGDHSRPALPPPEVVPGPADEEAH